LTQVDLEIDNGPMNPYYESIAYDGIGNITSYTTRKNGSARNYQISYGDARFPILPTDIEVTGSQPVRETFTYDHSGSRIQRELDADNNPATANEISYFIPFGTENLAELDGRGRVRRAYCFAGGERTGYKAAGRTVLYLKDHLGSSKMTLDLYASTLQEGLLQRAGDADPYGVTWRESYAATAESEPHQYTGQEREAALDLYTYGARFYDPELGRFLAVDPAREFANPYSYVGNCPTMLIDLSGRFSERGMTQYQAKLDRDTAQDVMAIVRKAKAEGKSSLLAVGKAYPIQSGAIVSVGFYYLGTLWTPVMMWGVQHPVAISVTEQVVQGGVEAAFDVELPGLGIDELAEAGTKAVIKNGQKRVANEMLSTPAVDSQKLQNLVNSLYNGTANPNRVGNGTTMDAIRHELATGAPVGGKFHLQKGQESIRALENWLKGNPNASYRDRVVAESLLNDLRRAVGGEP